MAITYTWAVTGVKATTVAGNTDYVIQTYWTKTGTDENGITGVFSGATPLTPNPSQTSFVPYDQLTQDIVLSWIQPVVVGDYETHVNDAIAAQIAAKIDPVTEPALPWAEPVPDPTPPAV